MLATAALVLLHAIARPQAAPAKSALPDAAPTINALYSRGVPDFVAGTLGDDASDRAVRAQIRLLRGMLFPSAPIADDTALVKDDAIAWPARPIVYGGAHVNALVRRCASDLPFRVDVGRIEIAGQKFEGSEFRLIAAVPARAGKYPDFLLYAGAGAPGVAEINAVKHGPEGWLVIDRFGARVRGTWERASDGEWKAVAGAQERRIEWRATKANELTLWRPSMLAAKPSAAAEDAALARALVRARAALHVASTAVRPIDCYVYPDRGSKRALCLNAGDGHVDIASRTLHVIAFEASERGGLESLATHELAHVLASDVLGAAGSSLQGEGLAVWASGVYAGKSLEQWRGELATLQPASAVLTREALMGAAFAKTPESRTYPLAGLWVESVVAKVGWKPFAAELYGADAEDWDGACLRAGATAAELDACWPTPAAR